MSVLTQPIVHPVFLLCPWSENTVTEGCLSHLKPTVSCRGRSSPDHLADQLTGQLRCFGFFLCHQIYILCLNPPAFVMSLVRLLGTCCWLPCLFCQRCVFVLKRVQGNINCSAAIRLTGTSQNLVIDSALTLRSDSVQLIVETVVVSFRPKIAS